MNNEIAAAERVAEKLLRDLEGIHEGLLFEGGSKRRIIATGDIIQVCTALIAERDETQVDEAWLRSIGAESLSGDEVLIGWEDDYGHPLAFDIVDRSIYVYGDRVLHDVDNPTRGQLLRLLSSLNITNPAGGA